MGRFPHWIKDGSKGFLLPFLFAGTAIAHASPAGAADTVRFDIERQPLAAALKEFAQISDNQVLFRESDVAARQSVRLSGKYDVDRALTVMLRGSGLVARRVADRTLIIEPAPRQSEPMRSEGQARPALRAKPARPPDDAFEAQAFSDILVTARRYSEPLQQTPVAVSQFTVDELARAGVNNLQDLDGLAPGLSIIENNGGVSGIFVRRIGHDDWLLSTDPGVGIYLDGVYLGRIFGSGLDTLDVSRIEVLRGPQGILYGRNSEAGTINIHSARPSDRFEASSELWFGTRGRIDFTNVANVPLTDTSALRVAFKLRRQDGYIKNLEGGADAGDINRQSGRLSYLRDLPSGIRLSFSADYYRQRELGLQYNIVGVSAVSDPNLPTASKIEFWNRVVAPAIGEAPLDQRYIAPMRTTHSTTGLQSDVDHWGLNLTLEGNAGAAQWKSISGLRRVSTAWGADYDRSPATLWMASVPYARQTQLSEEIQVSGQVTPKLKYTSGLFLFSEIANDHHVIGLPISAIDVLSKAAPHSVPAPGYEPVCVGFEHDREAKACLGLDQGPSPVARLAPPSSRSARSHPRE